MPKNLLIFPFGFRGKTRFVLENYLGGQASFLYLTAHWSRLNDFVSELSCLRSSAVRPHCFTLKQLARKLVEENAGARLLTDLEKYVLLLEVLSEYQADQKSRIPLAGLAQAVHSFIREIKVSLENPQWSLIRDQVSEFPWKFRENLDQVLSVLDTAEAYEQSLRSQNLLDAEDVYRAAEGYVEKLADRFFFLEGVTEITAHQKGFLKRLISHIPEGVVAFNYDEGVPFDSRTFILDKTLLFLNEITAWKKTQLPAPEALEPERCYHFPSIEEETRGIVNLLQGLLDSEPGLRPEDCLAVFPNMPQYRPFVRRIFSRYNMPAEIIPGLVLSEEASVTSLLEIFSFLDNYSWLSLMNILTSPFFGNLDQAETRKFSEQSRRMFEGRGFFKSDFDRMQGKNFSLLRTVLKKLGRSGRKPLKRWVADLKQAMKELNWQPGRPETKELFSQCLERLSSPVSVTRDEMQAVLNKSLDLVEVERGEGQGIRVSGVLETAGLEKKVCFLAGVTEENVPMTPRQMEIFLPDKLKKTLGLADAGLKLARERLDLYRLRTGAGRMFFTYPTVLAGKNQLKSILIREVPEEPYREGKFAYRAKQIFQPDFSWEKFDEKFLREKHYVFSVTTLESFLRCAYRFYLSRVEGVTVYQAPEIEETPLFWGSLIHRVLKEIFQSRIGKAVEAGDIPGLQEDFRQKVTGYLENPGRLKQARFSGLFEEILKARLTEVTGKFGRILEQHLGHRLAGLEEDVAFSVGRLKLTGRLDRLEVTAEGESEIIDIKTGAGPFPSYTRRDFFDKHNLQLPLYLWILKKLGRSPAAGYLWNFSFLIEEDAVLEKCYPAEKFSYLDEIEELLQNLGEKISRRQISFVPEAVEVCFTCEYRRYCPYGKD